MADLTVLTNLVISLIREDTPPAIRRAVIALVKAIDAMTEAEQGVITKFAGIAIAEYFSQPEAH